ncbi:MAG: hypothetical protein ACOYMN_08865 [Roseimicrobium sp.]
MFMICPVDETVVFDADHSASPGDAVVACFLEVEQFVDQGAQLVARCLGEDQLRTGLVQGSRFCCAVSYDSEGGLLRGLVSPEEMSIHMALGMLHADE